MEKKKHKIGDIVLARPFSDPEGKYGIVAAIEMVKDTMCYVVKYLDGKDSYNRSEIHCEYDSPFSSLTFVTRDPVKIRTMVVLYGKNKV